MADPKKSLQKTDEYRETIESLAMINLGAFTFSNSQKLIDRI